MHANNETGQLTEIRWISSLCKKYDAIFHSDCVQTIGHYPINLFAEGVHMASASAHKFHGPKGIGFLYVHEDLHPSPLLFGGGQERGYRAGTENVAAIVGMAEALHLSYKHFQEQQSYILGLKNMLSLLIKEAFPSAIVNSRRFSLYSVLSVAFPKNEQTEFLLMELDRQGICASGGSACSGGGSHVMKKLGMADKYVTIRFSFSRHNTKDEVIRVEEVLKTLIPSEQDLSCTSETQHP
jgi:cysteine desulfurase